ncbi:MAG: tetratricopeptide repeat protein, partial [Desulfuromonadales bacterium]|nr:tetratricopeptide repeat protein [Desulfuromonadales bacterium]
MANKDKLLESAQKFLAKGQLPKAIGEYQKVVEAFPKDYRNRQKLAELLSREKRNDEAQPHYEAVAKNFTETGFYLKSIAIYKQMQKIEPGRVDIYLRLAELNEKQGLIGNALNEYRSLVAFYDKNRMGRETVGVLQKMIALEPDNLGFRGKLIETFVAIGCPEDALEQLRTLVRLLVSKGEHVKVVKLYEKFLDLCPEDVENRLPLAEALLASGQAEKALVLLKGLLKQAPDHPSLLTALTDCHMALGNHADARLTCQHLLKEHSQDLDLRERYVRVCIAGADHERALACLEEAKEAFSEAGRVGVLKELYETLQQALPDNARLQATLAAIYEATGEPGAQPGFSSAGVTGAVEEETADAAILDAAIGDVEHLDLVGDAVAPPVEVPPVVAPVVTATPAKAKGGLELELDLDLDLDLTSAAPPSIAPASVAAPVPPEALPEPAAPIIKPPLPPVPSASAPAPSLDMELELDLGGLDELEFELPPVEPMAPVEMPEPTATVSKPEPESSLVPEPVAEELVELPVAGSGVESAVEDVTLPDLDELEFEIEPSPEVQSAGEAMVLGLPDLEGLLTTPPEAVEPVAEEVEPVAEEVEPVAEEVEPVAEEVEPVAEEVEPVAEEVEPVAEEVAPAAEEVEPVAEEV